MKLEKTNTTLTEVVSYKVVPKAKNCSESTVLLTFKNGVFSRVDEYFNGYTPREKSKVRAIIEKKIKKIEKRYRKKEAKNNA